LWVGLAALTKQTAVAAVLPIGGYLLIRSRARLLVFLVTVGVVGGGGFAILDRLNDGWLRYYTITLPSHHETNAAAYLDFWTQDVSRLLPLGLAALAIGWLARRCDDLPRSALSFYGIVFVVFLGVSYSSRIHAGGARNVVMPAFFAGALLFAIAVHAAAALVEGRGQASKADDPARAARPSAFGIGLHLFTLLQLSLLLYLPWRQLPSSSDRRAGAAFIALLGRLPGDVYVMDHGWYAALAGKPTFAQGMALLDVLRGDRGPVGQQLASELASAVRARRFGAIVVGTTVPTRDAPGDASARRDALWNNGILLPWMPADFVEALRTEYQPAAHLYRDSRDFAPVVGWRRRPAVVYVPH
jgi:hypothetical protein